MRSTRNEESAKDRHGRRPFAAVRPRQHGAGLGIQGHDGRRNPTELRRRLRAVRGELRVAKNTLVRRAIQETNFAALDGQLGGPVGVIFSFEDPIAVAKTVTSFKEAGDKFKLRGGVLEGKPLSREEVQDLANMPPKEVVMAPVARPVAGPGQRLGAACSTSPARPWRG